MIKIFINNKYAYIRGARPAAIQDLEKICSYYVAGFVHSKQFQARRWDGREHLLNFVPKKGHRIPVGLVSDVLSYFEEKSANVKIINKKKWRNDKIDTAWNDSITLRPYQQEAVEAMCGGESWEKGGGLLKMPIRSGKTKTAAGIIHKMKRKTLFIVPSQMLLYQTADSLNESLCTEVGMIGDGIWNVKAITVATIQTLAIHAGRQKKVGKRWVNIPPDDKFNSISGEFDLVIFDECFVAGTKIGDKEIQNIKVGDEIQSFDGKNRLMRKKVTHLFKKRPSSLLRIKAGRHTIVCTPNHPIKTPNGFVPALLLREKDYIMRSNIYLGVSNGEMFMVRRLRRRKRNKRLSLQSIRNHGKNLLFNTLWKSGLWRNIPKQSTSTFKRIKRNEFAPNENKQSDVFGKNKSQIIGNVKSEQTHPTMVERRKWTTNTDSGKIVIIGIRRRMEIRIRCENERRQRQWKTRKIERSELIQNRCSAPDAYDRHRNRWHIAHRETKKIRREKGRVLEKIRVESVEILQPTSDGTYGGLCPDGFVYNLEVEDTHTYIANGIGVHNCHHLAAESWHNIILGIDCRCKIGLSATLELENVRELERGVIWLKACCGRIRYQVETSYLIEQGYLMRQNIEIIPIRQPMRYAEWRWSRDLQNQLIYENEHRNITIVEKAIEKLDSGLKVLIISNRHNQLLELHKLLVENEISHAIIIGNDSAKSRKEKVEAYLRGEFNVLLGSVFGEGIDIPEIECVINAEGGRDVKATVQRMRNMTPAIGKTEAVFIDFADLTNKYFARHSRDRLEVYRSEPAFIVKIIE
jgi:superfamily II DNA or RNA helicase